MSISSGAIEMCRDPLNLALHVSKGLDVPVHVL